MTPARLADRLARLRYDPKHPDAFLAERSELALAVRLLPVPASPRAIRYVTPDPAADARVRRLVALLAARDRENRELRRLLGAAHRRPRPRRLALAGQLLLPLRLEAP